MLAAGRSLPCIRVRRGAMAGRLICDKILPPLVPFWTLQESGRDRAQPAGMAQPGGPPDGRRIAVTRSGGSHAMATSPPTRKHPSATRRPPGATGQSGLNDVRTPAGRPVAMVSCAGTTRHRPCTGMRDRGKRRRASAARAGCGPRTARPNRPSALHRIRLRNVDRHGLWPGPAQTGAPRLTLPCRLDGRNPHSRWRRSHIPPPCPHPGMAPRHIS